MNSLYSYLWYTRLSNITYGKSLFFFIVCFLGFDALGWKGEAVSWTIQKKLQVYQSIYPTIYLLMHKDCEYSADTEKELHFRITQSLTNQFSNEI